MEVMVVPRLIDSVVTTPGRGFYCSQIVHRFFKLHFSYSPYNTTIDREGKRLPLTDENRQYIILDKGAESK